MRETAIFLTMDGVTNGAIYALIALGIILIYSVTRVINIAQGDFAMLGALTMVSLRSGELPGTLLLVLMGLIVWILMDAWKFRREPRRAGKSAMQCVATIGLLVAGGYLVIRLGSPMVLALAYGMILVGTLGAVLHRVAIEPIPGANVVVYIIITLGAHMVLQGLALAIWGPEAYPVDALVEGYAEFGTVTVARQSLVITVVTMALFMALFVIFRWTIFGKALVASAVNRMGARLCGIAVSRNGRIAFFISSAFAAIGGMLIAPLVGAHYEMGFIAGLKGFVGATLGSLIYYSAGILGAVGIGVVESIASYIISPYRDALVFLMIIPILLVQVLGRGRGRGR